MRDYISAVRTRLKPWISIFAAAASATLVLGSQQKSLAAALENPWPCETAGCQEVCKYQGKIDLGGTIHVQTTFSRDRQNPKNFTARSQVSLSASVLFWRVEYFIDEEDSYESNPERLRRVDFNSRYILNGNLKRQTWDRSRFFDGPAPGLGYTEAYRIEGTHPDDFAKRYGAFSEFFPVTALGENWQAGFDAAKPDRRPDLDFWPVQESTTTPITLDFIKSRFLDPTQSHKFQAFMNGHPNPGGAPLEMSRAPNSSNSATADISWNVDLSFINDVQNSPDQPSVLVVNPATHNLKEVQLHLRDSILSVNANMTLQGCQISR